MELRGQGDEQVRPEGLRAAGRGEHAHRESSLHSQPLTRKHNVAWDSSDGEVGSTPGLHRANKAGEGLP